jgi:hypothetical protein
LLLARVGIPELQAPSSPVCTRCYVFAIGRDSDGADIGLRAKKAPTCWVVEIDDERTEVGSGEHSSAALTGNLESIRSSEPMEQVGRADAGLSVGQSRHWPTNQVGQVGEDRAVTIDLHPIARRTGGNDSALGAR